MPALIAHIEFRSSDFGRTSAFYAKLFDWKTEQNASATYMKLDAGAGAGGVSGGWVRSEFSQAPGPLIYLAVDDLTAKLAEVEEAGGRVIAARLPFAGGGEVGLFADPDGNVLGLWAPKDKGAPPPPPPKTAPKPATAPKAVVAAKPEAPPKPEAAAKPKAAAGDKGDKKAKKR
jgi:hypothetical protein